jgi:hypothetical protein
VPRCLTFPSGIAPGGNSDPVFSPAFRAAPQAGHHVVRAGGTCPAPRPPSAAGAPDEPTNQPTRRKERQHGGGYGVWDRESGCAERGVVLVPTPEEPRVDPRWVCLPKQCSSRPHGSVFDALKPCDLAVLAGPAGVVKPDAPPFARQAFTCDTAPEDIEAARQHAAAGMHGAERPRRAQPVSVVTRLAVSPLDGVPPPNNSAPTSPPPPRTAAATETSGG